MVSPPDEGPRAGARRRREYRSEGRARRAEVDDPTVVLEAAARFLEVRPRSIGETRRHLLAAGYRSELVADALERLADLGILDDAAFARAWVESRDRAHPRGRRALQRELILKGIDSSLIVMVLDEREALGASAGGEDSGKAPLADERAAGRLLERKAATLVREGDPRRRRQRAYLLLVRNGFESGVASAAAERWTRTEAGEPSEPSEPD